MNSRFFKIIALLAGIGSGIFNALRQRPASHKWEKTNRTSVQTPPPSQEGIVGKSTSVERPRVGMKRWLLRFGVLGLLLALGGLIVAASGVIPIKASSGHWAVTQWFLQFSKSRSVATHTLGVKVPALDEPGLVLKGAGHYEIGCAPCHGSPHRAQPRVAEHMLPRPPDLKHIRSKRDPAELFYIVKHGIKLTGMPAWPSLHREDELWAMVAFLCQLPKMESAEYQRLVNGEMRSSETESIDAMQPPEKMPRAVAESCARCHGLEGEGRGGGAFPRLARQRREYLLGSLQAYARRDRHSGIMGPIAAPLSAETMNELATYYAQLPARLIASGAVTNTEAIQRGKSIALHGIPSRRVPPCIECHGPRTGAQNPHYPALAGQAANYLVLQLQLFSKQHRGGTAYAHLMHFVARHLTPEQMHDVTHFYESLTSKDSTVTTAK